LGRDGDPVRRGGAAAPAELCAKRRRQGEFKQLRDDEVARIEGIVRDAFEGFQQSALR
jgi:hypothetical protein